MSRSSLLLLSQRCVASLEAEPFERRNAEFRSCLESLYVLIDQLITQKQKSAEECRAQLSLIIEKTGASNLSDCLHVILGLNKGSRAQKLILAEYPILFPLLVSHLNPFRVRYVSHGRTRPGSRADRLDKMKMIKDVDIVNCGRELDCIDLCRSEKDFLTRVQGLEILCRDAANSRWLVISCMVSNVCPMSLHSPWITKRRSSLHNAVLATRPGFHADLLHRGLDMISLKDYFIYSDEELAKIYLYNIDKVREVIRRPISGVANEFLTLDRFQQRKQLIRLLLCKDKCEYYYTAYLLYDLLSTESEVSGDTVQQLELLSSLPWKARTYFKDAMISTVRYTETLSLGEEAKIPLAQQVCLLKVNDRTKSKAMSKLREVKAKSEDSGSKARQYLEGLLKIPFGSYRQEDVLVICEKCLGHACDLRATLGGEYKDGLSRQGGLADAQRSLNYMTKTLLPELRNKRTSDVLAWLQNGTKQDVVSRAKSINSRNTNASFKIRTSKSIADISSDLISAIANREGQTMEILESLGCDVEHSAAMILKVEESIDQMERCIVRLSGYMRDVSATLDRAVHGHSNAKRQVQRIIGQWMTGESTGYCFGFEGPPGVGKTSLAKKGIAKCLVDEAGIARPFSFIAIGGASNSSTLDGHNYTYVGSTWGRIVDTVMEAGCLNPIIFIDELDKISRTEHGKEIIGILTHLVDPSQNECFQDKYFAGVDIDLSKALIIFSYNDASLIDRILLDRIHRIKFDSLSLDEKMTISRDFLVPEARSKMGLPSTLGISDNGLRSIITEYTQEAGVRQLKEILFEIFGEINLEILSGDFDVVSGKEVDVPDIKGKYLQNRVPCIHTRAPEKAQVGVISGLWANSLGLGGILHIEVEKFPNDGKGLVLNLTGKQGDVMKESAEVALSVARRACSNGENLNYTVHIHVPDGATPKDGPSAGVAITCALISSLRAMPLDNSTAVTGEICLQGKVKAVGGLGAKIAGAIRAGIKHVFYPSENREDIDKLIRLGKINAGRIELTPIQSITEIIDKILLEA